MKFSGITEEGETPTRGEFNLLLGIVVGIAVVCGLGFLTLLMNYYQQSALSYQNLSNQVQAQNTKIDLLLQKK